MGVARASLCRLAVVPVRLRPVAWPPWALLCHICNLESPRGVREPAHDHRQLWGSGRRWAPGSETGTCCDTGPRPCPRRVPPTRRDGSCPSSLLAECHLSGGARQDQSTSRLPRGQAPADLGRKEKPGRWGVGTMRVLESPGSNQDLDPPREGPEKQEVSGCLGAGCPLF